MGASRKGCAWLSPKVIADIRGLWEWRLGVEKLVEIEKLIAERKEAKYRNLNSYV